MKGVSVGVGVPGDKCSSWALGQSTWEPFHMIPEDRFSQKKEITEIKISKKSTAACHQFITKYLLWAGSGEFNLSSRASCMWAAEGPAAVGQMEGLCQENPLPGPGSPMVVPRAHLHLFVSLVFEVAKYCSFAYQG